MVTSWLPLHCNARPALSLFNHIANLEVTLEDRLHRSATHIMPVDCPVHRRLRSCTTASRTALETERSCRFSSRQLSVDPSVARPSGGGKRRDRFGANFLSAANRCPLARESGDQE